MKFYSSVIPDTMIDLLLNVSTCYSQIIVYIEVTIFSDFVFHILCDWTVETVNLPALIRS